MSDLILKTEKDIGYNAINVGEYDLTMGIGYLKSWYTRLLLPFISANLKDKRGQLVFKPFKVVDVDSMKVGIIGVMKGRIHLSRVPDGASYQIADPFQAVEDQVKLLKKKKVNFIIVLTDITAMGCEKIAHMKLPINIIVGSGRRNRLSLPKISYQRLILHLDRFGKHIGKLSLFCEHENARQRTLLLENNIFGGFTYGNAFIALKKALPRDVKIAEMMDSYVERIRLLKTKLALSSSQGGTPSPVSVKEKRFMGANTCKKCHPKNFQRWSKTEHSRAYLALVKKGSQYDEDCIGCHSIGFRQNGGFQHISKSIKPFVNVQCEACHGAGDLHVKSGGDPKEIRTMVSREVCLRCHTEEQSPDFIYRVYLSRISCGGNIPKARVKAQKNTYQLHKQNN